MNYIPPGATVTAKFTNYGNSHTLLVETLLPGYEVTTTTTTTTATTSNGYDTIVWAPVDASGEYVTSEEETINTGNLSAFRLIDPAIPVVFRLYNAGLTAISNIHKLVNLTSLEIQDNDIETLNLGSSINLTSLACYNNPLTTLSLSGCTALEILNCGGHLVETLDFSGFSTLRILQCGSSEALSSLTLAGCEGLTNLNVESCVNLTSLDLSECPALESLVLDNCTGLTDVDISENPQLSTVSLIGAGLGQAAIDQILLTLNAGAIASGSCQLAGNSRPSASGLSAMADLEQREWDVNIEPLN